MWLVPPQPRSPLSVAHIRHLKKFTTFYTVSATKARAAAGRGVALARTISSVLVQLSQTSRRVSSRSITKADRPRPTRPKAAMAHRYDDAPQNLTACRHF